MQKIEELVKELGFLCYNMVVDGRFDFPEMKAKADLVKGELGRLMHLRNSTANIYEIESAEDKLKENINELGFICYNLYVDGKLNSFEVKQLCEDISSLMVKDIPGSNEFEANLTEGDFMQNYQFSDEKDNFESPVMPFGLEDIPDDYKECLCGYKNISEANFCGRCGKKLT